jgi:colanic acid biosynthesis glycosyl transferase WcaI
MMASSVPSLVTGSLESEVAKVFKKSQGGYFYDSDAFDNVVNSINILLKDRDKAKQMGFSARKYIVNKFSSKIVLEEFEKKISEIVGD